jgi:hypothetical protein
MYFTQLWVRLEKSWKNDASWRVWQAQESESCYIGNAEADISTIDFEKEHLAPKVRLSLARL